MTLISSHIAFKDGKQSGRLQSLEHVAGPELGDQPPPITVATGMPL